jgi:hypothetical protein
MSVESDQIKKCVQQLADTFNKDSVKLIIATVTDNSKAESDFIVSVKPINDSATTPINNVKLNTESNDGWLIVPAVDSTVLVISSTINKYYCLMYSDIEKIVCVIDSNNSYKFSSNGFVWNDGLFGGMVKINALLTKLNQLEIFENTVKAAVVAINTSASGSPSTPVTNATLAAFFATIIPTLITPTSLTEIEDIKIKH